MEPNTLSQFYDTLKANLSQDQPAPQPVEFPKNQVIQFHKICGDNSAALKDRCKKHIILDIYAKILPLDDEWKNGHMGILRDDVDKMLAAKGDNATQYLTSAYEKTKAPMLEFVIRNTDLIGDVYLKEAEEELKDAEANNEDIPPVEEPSEDTDDIQSQLVDIKQDGDYESFVDELKKKTIAKIVNDVSELIEGEKEKNDMTFDTPDNPVSESVVLACVDYLQKNLKENVEHTHKDDLLNIAIREATMYEMNRAFNLAQPFTEFAKVIRTGHGVVINESAITYLVENVNADGSPILG